MPWPPGSRRPRPSRPRSSPRRPRSEVVNLAPSSAGRLAYFGPAVLALILQHLAVTLVALSLVRERTTGVMELFRIAPVSTSEVLTGKVLAYGLLGGAIAALTMVLLVGVLRRPDARPDLAVIVRRDRPAAASRRSAWACSSRSSPTPNARRSSCRCSCCWRRCSSAASCWRSTSSREPVRVLAYLLPVTHGIRLLQDLMLRGSTNAAVAVLGARPRSRAVTLVVAWALLRRSMARA